MSSSGNLFHIYILSRMGFYVWVEVGGERRDNCLHTFSWTDRGCDLFHFLLHEIPVALSKYFALLRQHLSYQDDIFLTSESNSGIKTSIYSPRFSVSINLKVVCTICSLYQNPALTNLALIYSYSNPKV